MGSRLQTWTLALLLWLPSVAHAGDVRWLVPDDDQAARMEAVGQAVWRGDSFEVAVFEWPPGQLSADDADRAPGMWTCWLREGEEPGIVVALEGMAERLLIPLSSDGLSEVEAMRAAVMLTMSLQRSIEIGDAGWMPAADLAALLGASVEPAEPVEPTEPPPPVEPVVEPAVEPVVEPAGPEFQVGAAVGPALRPASGTSALGATARFSVVRGPWLGPGIVVGIEALGSLEPESYGVSVLRATVAGRWQLTPEQGPWWFPIAVGLGAAFTSARIADPFEGTAEVGVPPVLLADAGVARHIGSRVSLSLTVQLAVDLIPVRVLVQGEGTEASADLHPFVLLPRVELVFHPGPR